MADPAPTPKKAPDNALGIYDRSSRSGGRSRQGLAILFTLLWLGVWGGYYLLLDPAWRESMAGLTAIIAVLAAVLPLIAIWALIGMLAAQDEIREDSQKLQEALAAIRQASIAQQQRQSAGVDSKLVRKIDDLTDRIAGLEAALAAAQAPSGQGGDGQDGFADEDDPALHAALDDIDTGIARAELSPEPVMEAETVSAAVEDPVADPEPAAEEKLQSELDLEPKFELFSATVAVQEAETETETELPEPEETAVDSSQGDLALDLPNMAEASLPSADDFIRALNFPETVDDTAGFAALRRAMRDRRTSQLIQAAEDILTLLSQEGIYMDELRPDLAKPEIWRLFARGARGRTVADLGGIHDREVLAQVTLRMRQDAIFRDAAHHFLRRFDRAAAEFEPHASDGELSAFGNTRSARAFMILARAAGTFD